MRTLIFIAIITCFLACKNEQKAPESAPEMIETVDYAFTCNLKDDADLIEKYEYYHSKEGVWPEVTKTFEASGASSIKIFRQATRLVLIVTLPKDISFDEFSEKYSTTSEKIKEWDEIMAGFQLPPPGAEEGQTWVPMKKMYEFINN